MKIEIPTSPHIFGRRAPTTSDAIIVKDLSGLMCGEAAI
jgi:hypothetical protein